MKCEICNVELTGKQKRFCCRKHAMRDGNRRNQMYENQQSRGLTRKLNFVNKLGGQCEICGYNKNLAVLNFHHKDPSKKEIKLDIRSMSNNNLDVLTKEVEKCQLVCSNCHGEIHHPTLKMVPMAESNPQSRGRGFLRPLCMLSTTLA